MALSTFFCLLTKQNLYMSTLWVKTFLRSTLLTKKNIHSRNKSFYSQGKQSFKIPVIFLILILIVRMYLTGPPQRIWARQGPIFYPKYFDQLFLIRAYWNPKFRQGPGLGGLTNRGGPVLDLRNLQEQVKKASCFKYSDFSLFESIVLVNFKSSSQSLEHFFFSQ